MLPTKSNTLIPCTEIMWVSDRHLHQVKYAGEQVTGWAFWSESRSNGSSAFTEHQPGGFMSILFSEKQSVVTYYIKPFTNICCSKFVRCWLHSHYTVQKMKHSFFGHFVFNKSEYVKRLPFLLIGLYTVSNLAYIGIIIQSTTNNHSPYKEQ